jgi:hypothetical protein
MPFFIVTAVKNLKSSIRRFYLRYPLFLKLLGLSANLDATEKRNKLCSFRESKCEHSVLQPLAELLRQLSYDYVNSNIYRLMKLCKITVVKRGFEATYCLHLHYRRISQAKNKLRCFLLDS